MIRTFFTSLRMVGVFLFILIMALIIIGAGLINVFAIDRGIRAVAQEAQERLLLETIEYYILDQELAERRYISGTTTAAERLFEQAEAQLDVLVPQYAALTDSAASVAIIEEERDLIDEDFAAIQAGELATPEALDEAFRAEAELNQHLNNLVFETSISLDESIDALRVRDRQSTLLGFVGLLLFPLLAVWAFLVVSRLTEPLLNLTNAIVSMGGGHYNEELIANDLKRGDVLGDLARILHETARSAQQQEADLQEEIAALQDQYTVLRRRNIVMGE